MIFFGGMEPLRPTQLKHLHYCSYIGIVPVRRRKEQSLFRRLLLNTEFACMR